MKELILENAKYIGWVLFFSGVVFEISPIKINPISSLLGWIGKKLNRDVKEDIIKLQTDVKNVQSDLQDHKVESWRREILDFADAVMHGAKKTKENFDYIIKLHDKYEKYIKEKNIENGQIDLAFGYISTNYKECMKNNSFYNGK